jgi:hypothetical protein
VGKEEEEQKWARKKRLYIQTNIANIANSCAMIDIPSCPEGRRFKFCQSGAFSAPHGLARVGRGAFAADHCMIGVLASLPRIRYIAPTKQALT